MAESTILVTGGAGFIGSNFILQWLASERSPVVNLDRLTYAGNPHNLDGADADRCTFVHGDIADAALVADLFHRYRPAAVVHCAAESHVDRSIYGPREFVRTNVLGTLELLNAARQYWQGLPEPERQAFRFLHVSTDEVYGALAPDDPPFTECSAYAPSSPYAASKAGSDHLVRAFHRTYGLPTLILHSANNYGPRQFPEKLIPLVILNALSGKPIPLYGDGRHLRTWLYVEDQCSAMRAVLAGGTCGESYNVGSTVEMTNLDVVRAICCVLGQECPGRDYESLITFIADRPGHDRRYALNCRKIQSTIGWEPREDFQSGIRKTVRWYLDNPVWIENVTSGVYQQWIKKNYQERGAR